MDHEVLEALKQLERDRGISVQAIVEALKSALLSAFKKKYGDIEGSRVEIDMKTGAIMVLRPLTKEEGGVEGEEIEITPEDFGRVAAQMAKQVIRQTILEQESERVYQEYKDRVGEVVTGIVQQSHERLTLIDLGGNVEALLPYSEQIPGEKYPHGRRLKVYIIDVRKSTRGPGIIVSRTHPGLLKRLFELEVPEVSEGIVEIKAIAREAGQRSKVAVYSKDPRVDPVGACVGQRGSRVKVIVNELNGEKIDILNWSEDPAEFVKNAMKPAKTTKVTIDEESRTALVVVPDDQQSLAIGRDGQNARLAAKLTGLRIDVKSESEVAGVERAATASQKEEEELAPVFRQCAAIRRDGTRCPNRALPGSDYCGIPAHQKQAEQAAS